MLVKLYYLTDPYMIIHLLGDECMLLTSIILSAPPRCMWHGRVTHDPNRLCICIQKQILNNAQIQGELLLITYFSKRQCFSLLLSFVEALIYMLSSITKKGEIESTSAPQVVLVINVNISLVGLTLLSSIFQISSTLEWHGLMDVGTPSRC